MLARTVAHTTDVDAMLDAMDPREFAEWFAAYKIQPWGMELDCRESDKPKNSLDTFRSLAGM